MDALMDKTAAELGRAIGAGDVDPVEQVGRRAVTGPFSWRRGCSDQYGAVWP